MTTENHRFPHVCTDPTGSDRQWVLAGGEQEARTVASATLQTTHSSQRKAISRW